MESGTTQQLHPTERLIFGDFEIDERNRVLLRSGEPVPMTAKVFDLLVFFARNPHQLLEKNEILDAVWNDSFIEEGNVSRNVSFLRKVLGDTGREHKYIVTVQGRGYRFIGDVTHISLPPDRHESNGLNGFYDSPANGYQLNGNGIHTSEPPVPTHRNRALLFTLPLIAIVGLAVLVLQFGFSRRGSADVLTVEHMQQTRLTQSGDVYAPTVSPDGRFIVYIATDNMMEGLRLLQIGSGRVLDLLPLSRDLTIWSAGFSRDSSFVYYTQGGDGQPGTIYRIPSVGGEPQKVLDDGIGPSLSPDGRHIAFQRLHRDEGLTSLVVADADGSNQHTVTATDANSTLRSIDWSPDGSMISYVAVQHVTNGYKYYVATVSPNGGPGGGRIGDERDSRIVNAFWLPDQAGLITNELDAKTGQMQLFYLAYPSGLEHRITSDLNGYSGMSMTADGRSVVTQRMQLDREIWLVPDGDRNAAPRQVTSKKEEHFEAVGWLTNDTLVFDVDENGTMEKHKLWRLKLGDVEPQPLTSGPGSDQFPVVSPDGRTVAFLSNRSGISQVWTMPVGGTQATQLTNLDIDVNALAFAADGRSIYFGSHPDGKSRIMRVALTGGDPTDVIADADVYLWSLSPDGKRIAYSTLDTAKQQDVIRIRSLSGDQPEQTLIAEPSNWLEWTSDGRALLFASTTDAGRNVWRLDLSGGQPRPVTNFNDGKQIFRFFRSPDSKTLAMIRGHSAYDAVALNFR